MLLAVTQVMGNKHTIRNAFPLSGEARLYRAHVKNTSNSKTIALAPTFAITHGAVLLDCITKMALKSTARGLVLTAKPLTTDQYAVQSIGKRHSIPLTECIRPARLYTTAS